MTVIFKFSGKLLRKNNVISHVKHRATLIRAYSRFAFMMYTSEVEVSK